MRSVSEPLECGDLSPRCEAGAAGSTLEERRQVAALQRNRALFELEHWDNGRLTINRAFAGVLKAAGLTTFESLWSFTGGRVAKNVLRERTTTRLTLPDPAARRVGCAHHFSARVVGTAGPGPSPAVDAAHQVPSPVVGTAQPAEFRVVGTAQPTESRVVGTAQPTESRVVGTAQPTESRVVGTAHPTESRVVGTAHPTAFYLKRHAPPPWKEYLKPLLRLRRPLLGARHEWNAILRFHEIGIPTMTPVALGQSGRRSLLLTEALEGCRKLSELAAEAQQTGARCRPAAYLPRIAHVARTMHAAGLHHQDFYLTHLLVPAEDDGQTLYVIDLGRVRQRRRLARRWIVKDLAQLNYSARFASEAGAACSTERDSVLRRFLECYFGRSLQPGDQPLIDQVERKTRAIARHSRKHRL